jgi:hypothetical protein
VPALRIDSAVMVDANELNADPSTAVAFLRALLNNDDEGVNAIIRTAHGLDLALTTAVWVNRFAVAEFGHDSWDARLAAWQERLTGGG